MDIREGIFEKGREGGELAFRAEHPGKKRKIKLNKKSGEICENIKSKNKIKTVKQLFYLKTVILISVRRKNEKIKML